MVPYTLLLARSAEKFSNLFWVIFSPLDFDFPAQIIYRGILFGGALAIMDQGRIVAIHSPKTLKEAISGDILGVHQDNQAQATELLKRQDSVWGFWAGAGGAKNAGWLLKNVMQKMQIK